MRNKEQLIGWVCIVLMFTASHLAIFNAGLEFGTQCVDNTPRLRVALPVERRTG